MKRNVWSQSHSDFRGCALQTRPGAYKQYAGACTHACDVSADEEHAWSAGAHFQLGFLRGPGPAWQPHSGAGAAAESFAPGPDAAWHGRRERGAGEASLGCAGTALSHDTASSASEPRPPSAHFHSSSVGFAPGCSVPRHTVIESNIQSFI